MVHSPLALIAELTHRCPLHCIYCSNPLEMQKAESELSTEDWNRVFREAAELGVLHAHLTGGEPLARRDLNDLISGAHQAGLYTNLITSGVGLIKERLATLVDALEGVRQRQDLVFVTRVDLGVEPEKGHRISLSPCAAGQARMHSKHCAMFVDEYVIDHNVRVMKSP